MVTLQTVSEQSKFRPGEAKLPAEQFEELRAFVGRTSKVPDCPAISLSVSAVERSCGSLAVLINGTAEDCGDKFYKFFPVIRALIWVRYQGYAKKNEARKNLKLPPLSTIEGIRWGELRIDFAIPKPALCDSLDSRAARSGLSVVPDVKHDVVMLPGPIAGVRPVRVAANA